MTGLPVNVLTNPAATWPPPRPMAGAEAFLAGIAEEQRRYLAALGELGLRLAGPGDLVALAAGQTRLTREFLDAQRAILRRRVETDGEVAAVMAAAHVSSGVSDLPAPMPAGRVDLPAPRVAPAPVAPANSDAELARMVDGAFERPTAVAERELRALVDGWWVRECEEGKAILADARARASAVRHIAPEPIAERIDSVDEALTGAVSLDDLLDTLLRVLDDGQALPAGTADGVAQGERDAEHFDRFWRGGSAPARRGSMGDWLLVQVLLPMVSVVSVMALVLAVVG